MGCAGCGGGWALLPSVSQSVSVRARVRAAPQRSLQLPARPFALAQRLHHLLHEPLLRAHERGGAWSEVAGSTPAATGDPSARAPLTPAPPTCWLLANLISSLRYSGSTPAACPSCSGRYTSSASPSSSSSRAAAWQWRQNRDERQHLQTGLHATLRAQARAPPRWPHVQSLQLRAPAQTHSPWPGGCSGTCCAAWAWPQTLSARSGPARGVGAHCWGAQLVLRVLALRQGCATAKQTGAGAPAGPMVPWTRAEQLRAPLAPRAAAAPTTRQSAHWRGGLPAPLQLPAVAESR